jgi:hypothetical protein
VARHAVIADVEPSGPVAMGFSTLNQRLDTPFAGIIGGTTTRGTLVVPTPVGSVGAVTVYANWILHPTEAERLDFMYGWSFAVELSGNARPDEVSFSPSAAATLYFEGGFNRTQFSCREPEQPGGFVSSISLAPSGHGFPLEPMTLPALAMHVAADRPQGAETLIAELRFVDGLRPCGPGQPVSNYVNLSGDTRRPCNFGETSLTIQFTPLVRFVRGDAAADLRLDISDALVILRNLFGDGPPAPCSDAADSNDSGAIDISDAVYVLAALFLGGPDPPDPYPNCGLDPTEDSFFGCAAEPPCP